MDIKEIVESMASKSLIFKSIEKIEPNTIGSRKRVEIYLGVDLKSRYTLLFVIERKSRIVVSDVETLSKLASMVEKYKDIVVKKRFLIYGAPLCSHARKRMEAEGWRVLKKG